MTRRALVVTRPFEIAVLQRPELTPGPDEVLARPVYVGMCGTDIELLEGEVDPDFVRYPLTLGHEWSGVVEAVGPGVTGVAPGDAIVAEGIVPCGACEACRRGATNVCEIYDELGFTREGAASDQLLVPARLVHRLGTDVPLLDGALVEPASVVLQALQKVGVHPGDRVLVLGDGTIALLAVQLAALWSPATIAVVGRRAVQRDLALAAGATSFDTSDDVATRRFDVVVEAAGAVAAIRTAVGAVRRGGRLALLGYAGAGVDVPLPVDDLVNDDLTIVTSFGYTAAAWHRVVELVNARAINPSTLVTHRFDLDDYAGAFAALRGAEGPRGKVILEVGAAPDRA
jgi:2-desacetyl-2-hydroxyethyl bacteriochlorophyllide A dehydrogenase